MQFQVFMQMVGKILLYATAFVGGVLSAGMFQCSQPALAPVAVVDVVSVDTIRIDTVRREREQDTLRARTRAIARKRAVAVRDVLPYQSDTAKQMNTAIVDIADSTVTVAPFTATSNTVFLPLSAHFKATYLFPENEFILEFKPPSVVEVDITRYVQQTRYVEERRPLWLDVTTHTAVAVLTYSVVKASEK